MLVIDGRDLCLHVEGPDDSGVWIIRPNGEPPGRAWHACGVEIICWTADDKKDRIRLPTQDAATLIVLRKAIEAARAGGVGDSQVLWRLERGLTPATRAAARLVMGSGAVAVMTLLMALAVVTPTMRGAVAVAAVVVGTASALVVAIAWRRDVAIVIRGSGLLRRQSWGGISEIDLRAYRRVAVGESE